MARSRKTPSIDDVVLRAWTDEDFKKRLLSDGSATLREIGIKLPRGMKVVVHENTTSTRNIVIPLKPLGFTVSQAADRISGVMGTDDDGPTTFGGMKTCT